MRLFPILVGSFVLCGALSGLMLANSASSSSGIVLTEIGRDSAAYQMVIQPDEKLLVAGITMPNIDTSDIALARYQPNGTLDRSFGRQGTVITDFGGQEFLYGLVLLKDNQFLVIGERNMPSLDKNLILARYNADGSLDSSFGEAGKIIVGSEIIDLVSLSGVQALPDGRVLVGAEVYGSGRSEMAALHFLPNGTLQPDITQRPKFSHFERNSSLADIVLQPDGRVIIFGTAGIGSSPWYMVAARFMPDGSRDMTWGEAGVVRQQFGLRSLSVAGASLQNDGKVLVAGTTSENGEAFAVARLTSTGQVDTSFGNGGKAIKYVGRNASAFRVAAKKDGSIVAVGSSEGAEGGNPMVIAQLTPQGQFDNGFGRGGVVLLGGNRARAYGVTPLSDGKILVIGEQQYNSEYFRFFLAKLNEDGTLDNSFGNSP